MDENNQFSADKLLAATDDHTKLVFLCSPNNPTGNNLDRREMEKLLDTFQGLVIIDEAYSDFSDAPSFLADLDKYPNLIVFQTFSKPILKVLCNIPTEAFPFLINSSDASFK